MSFRILLPCVPFTVRINIFGSGKPTPFERALLKYLWATGGAPLDEIVDFLGLGRPVAFDLLLGLWSRRWAEVSLITGHVKLAKEVMARVEKNEFEGLQSADNAIELRFIYDLIDGNVAPLVRESILRGPGGAAYTYPRLARQKEKGAQRYPMDLSGFRQASQGELLRAIKMHPIYAKIRNDDLGNLEIEVPEPETQISQRHVRYFGVFFDPILSETESLELKVNDDRPELRFLGQELQDIIIDSLPQDSPLRAALVDAADHRATGVTERTLPLSGFLRHARHLEEMAQHPDNPIPPSDLELLRDLWEEARTRIITLAERRADLGASTRVYAGRGAVDGAVRTALTTSSGAFVLTSPYIEAGYLAEGEETLLHKFEKLHATKGRNLYIQTTTATAKDALGSFTTLGDSPTTAFSQRPAGAAHTRSSLALFDGNKLLIGSEPLLGRGADMAMEVCYSPRKLGLGTNALQDLLDRLTKDFALDSDASQRLRREVFGTALQADGETGSTDSDWEFQRTVQAIDDLIGRFAGQDAPKSDEDDAQQIKATPLVLRELGQHATVLVHWVRAESQSADLLFDSEIHDEVLELVRSAPLSHPLALGLSSKRDLTQNTTLLGAIAKRIASSTARVHLHVPCDKKLGEAVDELIRKFKGADRVNVRVSRQGSRRGFGFALAPGRCILSANGVGHRIRNAGRNRPGTEVGLSLYGEALCNKALALLDFAHDLAAYQSEVPQDWSKATRTTDGLLAVFEEWQETRDATHDGNAGANIVLPFLKQETPIPWKPSDPALGAVPVDLRYALLKAAAMVDQSGGGANPQAYRGATQAYANQCLRAGQFGHAAILAEHLKADALARPFIRNMLFAWSCRTPFHLGLLQLPRTLEETTDREIFLLLAGLLALDGLASELSPWLVGTDATFGFHDVPLDRLVRSIFHWAQENSHVSFRATEAEQFGDIDSVDEVWKDAAWHFAWWREKNHPSSSVRAVRDLIFADSREPLAELRLLFENSKAKPTAQHLIGFQQVLARHSELSSQDKLLNPSKRKKLARDYFKNAISRAKGSVTGNITGSGRTAYENYTIEAFDLVANLNLAIERDKPDLRATSALVSAARKFLDTGNVEGTSVGGDRKLTRPLTDALRVRLKSVDPQPPCLPPWALPTAPVGEAEPDWPTLTAALMTCELPDTSEKGLTKALAQLGDGKAGWSTDDLGQDPLFAAAHLLQRCGRMRDTVLPGPLIDRARRDFVDRLAHNAGLMIREIAALRATKHRAGIVDANFEREANSASDTLVRVRKALYAAVTSPDDAIADLAAVRASGVALGERLDELLRNKEGELLDGIEKDSPNHAYLRELLDRRFFDLARHLRRTVQLDQTEEMAWPSQTRDAAAAFSNIVWRSSSVDRVRQGLAEFAAERGLEPADTEFVDMLGTTMLAALEGRAPALLPGKFFHALLKYLGAELSPADTIEQAQGLWLLNTEAPSMIALAPYLVHEECGTRRLTIAVPWTKERLVGLDSQFARQGSGWRSAVFPTDTKDAKPAEHEDSRAALRDLSQLTKLLEPDAGPDPGLTHVPVVLSLLSRQQLTALPNITHANLVARCEAPLSLRALSIARHLAGQATAQEFRSWWDRKDGDPERRKASFMEAILGGSSTTGATTEKSPDLYAFLSGIASRFGVEIAGEDVHHHRNRLCLRALCYYSGPNKLNALDLFFAALGRRGRHASLSLPPELVGPSIATQRAMLHRLLGRLLPSVSGLEFSDIPALAQALEDAIVLAGDFRGAEFALETFSELLKCELDTDGRQALSGVDAARLTAELTSSGMVVPGEASNRYRIASDNGLLALAASLG